MAEDSTHPTSENAEKDRRVLVLAPYGRDGLLIAEAVQESGFSAVVCTDLHRLCEELEGGVGVCVMAEEAFRNPAFPRFIGLLKAQPSWSDVPMIVLTSPGGTTEAGLKLAGLLDTPGNVTHLERPVRLLTLRSAVRAAVRARERQYEVRDTIVAREAAIQNFELAVRQRDRFLATLGHELRNPLNALSTLVGLWERMGWAPELIDENKDILSRQVRHMTRLVDDLLDVARVTTGRLRLRTQDVDLEELVRRCAESMRTGFNEAGIGLEFCSDAAPVFVHGDPDRLEQVVSNLLTNALKFTPVGGRVEVRLSVEVGSAVLSVSDSGIGIPQDQLQHIFDPFTQAHVTVDRRHGGLGLGLAVVRGIVSLHEGEVTAESHGDGKGAKFVVRLPLKSRPRGERPAAPSVRRNGVPRRVLVVEDNADTRVLMRRVLASLGHHVETARDGHEGLAVALESRPEVILLDIGLPGLDGYEVARRIRAGMGEAPLLVAITGFGQPEDKDKAIASGFNAHVTKPVNVDSLSELLNDHRHRGISHTIGDHRLPGLQG